MNWIYAFADADLSCNKTIDLTVTVIIVLGLVEIVRRIHFSSSTLNRIPDMRHDPIDDVQVSEPMSG
jgi:hypothetical protein